MYTPSLHASSSMMYTPTLHFSSRKQTPSLRIHPSMSPPPGCILHDLLQRHSQRHRLPLRNWRRPRPGVRRLPPRHRVPPAGAAHVLLLRQGYQGAVGVDEEDDGDDEGVQVSFGMR